MTSNTPKIVGIGNALQESALSNGGADYVYDLDIIPILLRDPSGIIRDGDTLLVAEPKIFTFTEYQSILGVESVARSNVKLQCCTHPAREINCLDDIMNFRNLLPSDQTISLAVTVGRPNGHNYTDEQAHAIIYEWHRTPRLKLSEVIGRAARILGVSSLEDHWVRDLVTRHVGSAARTKPAHWVSKYQSHFPDNPKEGT